MEGCTTEAVEAIFNRVRARLVGLALYIFIISVYGLGVVPVLMVMVEPTPHLSAVA